MEVNRENVKKWVAALRSGDYKQATNQLRLRNSFCCLGVACDISKVGEWKDNNRYVCTFEDGYPDSNRDLELPPKVLDWLGMSDPDPIIDMINNSYLNCSCANDIKGWDFDKIADAIEKYYLSD